MTSNETKSISKLLKLANIATEFEHVSIDLVTHFHYLREEYGLAKLLVLVQEYVREKQSPTELQTPKTLPTKPNEDVL